MSKARILAVDDQRYFRELIEGLLDDEGYNVQTTSSGEEALHILEREDFDIVITDLVMPGIDGAELVRRIKERLPAQDVVMVTGVVDVKTAVDAMKQGATDYILKPFDRSVLIESINKILKRRRLRDEHARLMEENLEFMGVLSLFERASGLFSTLSVEPLAERLVEGLCLESRAQSGVVWVAEDPGQEMLKMVAARISECRDAAEAWPSVEAG
jgi:two-component system cell cycle response regulator